jgi:HPt (histidine-containing phosphotransfer) domain-containing protein
MLDRQSDDSSARVPPIDLAHLTRQTLGDENLKREVLELFLVQAAAAREELKVSEADARRRLAHRLVGSARAVGAFALAACAAELEASPQSEAAVERLPHLIEEVRLFVSQQMD